MKLLQQSIRSHIIYAVAVLLMAIPLLFVVIQHLVTVRIDETLLKQQKAIVKRLNNNNEPYPLAYIEHWEPNIKLTPIASIQNTATTFYSTISRDVIDHENEPYRVLSTDVLINGKSYNMQLSDSLLETEDLISSVVGIVFILLILIVSGLVIINRTTSKRIWKPFYQTIDLLHYYKIEKDAPLHFVETAITEFADLNNAIGKLTQRSQETYLSQKSFIDNASHEMQTPLAIIRGKLDLLLQTTLQKEQYALINDIHTVNQQMSHLHKSLLLLSKIENKQFTIESKISVAATIRQLIEQYEFLLVKNSNTIILERPISDFSIKANPGLIEIMLGNLLSNAIRHNKRNGNVSILIQNKTVSLSNDSDSWVLNAEKLFQQFEPQSISSDTIGLGLHITKKIADQYGYTVQYNYQQSKHIFTVRFV